MANITNVINVTVNLEGKVAIRDNMNIVALFTSERGKVLSSAKRYKVYASLDEVAKDFGTESKAYAHAIALFSQTPNPINGSGALAIIYHREKSETVPAEAGTLISQEIKEENVVSTLQRIGDGSFIIEVDKESYLVENLDFRTVVSIHNVIDKIAKALSGKATVEYKNKIIYISSLTKGVESSVTFLKRAEQGTFIGDILTISEGLGGVVRAGVDEVTLASETRIDALQIGKGLVNFKGFSFIDKDNDEGIKKMATWAQANSTLMYEVFAGSQYLEVSTSNVVWDIVLSGLTNCRMLFDTSGDRKLATAYMARMHVVNFNAEKTAITMHLKTLAGVSAREYDQDTIIKAKKVGLDIYTSIKDRPCLLTSGTNDFTDNRYNLIAFVDALQSDLFNLFKTTPTKIGQDIAGVNMELDTVEKTCRSFVKAGVFAPGEWNGMDTFGKLEQFQRGIRENGFFTSVGELADQSQTERQERISPPIQIAVKNRGAIHSADIIVNLNF